MKLIEYFKKQSKRIDQALNRYLPAEREYPRIVHEAMRYSLFSGGKRFRPVLTLACAQACGGGPEAATPAACAIEMIHTYSLVHDDLPCMDNDDYRRGKPTCHRKFTEAYAVLAGGALLTLAFEILTELKDSKRALRIIQVLTRAMGTRGMIGGQVVDKMFEAQVPDIAAMDFINIHKTGKLIAASCQIGAILAGASQTLEKQILRYGEYLGFAFQIVDDIMDNNGYLRFMNREEAYQKAKHLVERAQSEIRPLRAKSRWLNEIANFVLTREK